MSNQESIESDNENLTLRLLHQKLLAQSLQREASSIAFIAITTSASLLVFVLVNQLTDLTIKLFLTILGVTFTVLGIMYREITIFGIDSTELKIIRRIETELGLNLFQAHDLSHQSSSERQSQSTVRRIEHLRLVTPAWQWKFRAILIRTFSHLPLFIWLGYLLNINPFIAQWTASIDFLIFLWLFLPIIISLVTAYFITAQEEARRNEPIFRLGESDVQGDNEE